MADTDLRVPCSFEPRDPRDPKERSGRLLTNSVNSRDDAGGVRTGVAQAASPNAGHWGNAGASATGVPAGGHAGTAAIADAKLTASPAALNSSPSRNLPPQGVTSKTAAFKTTSTTTAITTTAGSPSQANAHVVSSSLNPAPGRERATQRRDSRPRLRLPASRTDLFATIKRQCCGFFSVGSGRVANGFLDAQRALELVRVFFFNEARETTIGAGVVMCAYS